MPQPPDQLHRPLRVCIDARLSGSGAVGGVEQFVIGLARGLSQLADETIEYSFLTYANNDEWLRAYLGGTCRIVHGLGATRRPGWSRVLRKAPFIRATAYKLFDPIRQRTQTNATLPPPQSDGLIENEKFDVMHFPTQNAFLTSVPSIYHPWDLQHLHLPQYFAPEVIRKREIEYRAFCAQAAMVVAATSWQKQDLIKHYNLAEDKVRVIAPAPVVEFYPVPTEGDLENARRKFALPPRFLYYPAQTWPHKNHIRLLQALARVREREGEAIPLVLTGKRNDHFLAIENKIAELNLGEQVRFLDYVSPLELQCLYRLCRAMVFPTLFEGFGMPILEAFLVGAPTACSNVTSLPEQAGDAALIFDPSDTENMAHAVFRLWSDDALCRELTMRAQKRVKSFTWERTARTFTAHYRRLSGCRLSADDELLVIAEETKPNHY
ncbi:MAG TPA: glycosyltransferase family 1 protein [Pyrinomonadaceae bacterium]|nr:glycosyltransferase family 1 protein [Pyrinomonadaceae bacterium]